MKLISLLAVGSLALNEAADDVILSPTDAPANLGANGHGILLPTDAPAPTTANLFELAGLLLPTGLLSQGPARVVEPSPASITTTLMTDAPGNLGQDGHGQFHGDNLGQVKTSPPHHSTTRRC
jgi:hypothetical protein